MMKATLKITFEDNANAPSSVERIVEFRDLRDPGGDEFVAQYLFVLAEKESRWGKYWLSLPDVSRFYRAVKQTFNLLDTAFSVYDDRFNTRAMWMEIGHTLLRVKSLLAKSRAIHEIQESTVEASEAESIRWHLHLDKMDHFDLGAIFLGKVSELTARLIFERLGASLIPNLDRSKDDWERDLTWTRIVRGFADRAGNPNLSALPDSEYEEVRKILSEFLDIETGKRLLNYEHKLVHRITPSVDDPRLYTHLESRELRPITDAKTGKKGWTKGIGGVPSSAEYKFKDLYDDAVQTLRHYVSLLERLDALPRFGPEAVAAAKER